MDLIKLNGYIPPAPSAYSIDYSDVNGEEAGDSTMAVPVNPSSYIETL